jgi:hypothetical protein
VNHVMQRPLFEAPMSRERLSLSDIQARATGNCRAEDESPRSHRAEIGQSRALGRERPYHMIPNRDSYGSAFIRRLTVIGIRVSHSDRIEELPAVAAGGTASGNPASSP